MLARPKVLIFALAAGYGLAALGCSEQAVTIRSCELAELCTQVTVERVTATCGTSATTAIFDRFADGSNTLDTCSYTGPTGEAFWIMRGCFQLSSSAAIVYSGAHDDTSSPDYVREDVAGLGDRAFFRHSAEMMRAQLLVLAGNLFVDVSNSELSDTTTAKSCMMTIANDVLAAQ